MDNVVITVLKSLGVDSTVFYQFIIFTIIFILLKVILFKRLQEVIEKRDDETLGRMKKANKKRDDADAITLEYDKKIEAVYVEVGRELMSQKGEVSVSESRRYKEEEDKILGDAKSRRDIIIAEVTDKQTSIMKEKNELVHDLLKKLL